ncbi:hypothetical protein AB5J56_35370 [Streptomyces sp. R21]|uniref:DUF3137 domain-containing protein n=1 Tax=Streptomyces sp. R21 TaxID=3238627 RepID=A0AB39PJ61_9ACTN
MHDDAQRRVRRNPLLYTAPIVLLVLLILVLLWETVRANVTGELSRQWPWRLRLMDMNALGSLLAVAVAGVLGRAQYARTVRPALGWRSTWVRGELEPDERAWQVGILNGGQHHAVVERVDYQCVPRGGEPGPWADYAGLIAELTAAGFVFGKDYRMGTFSRGFPLAGSTGHSTVTAGVFAQRFIDEIDVLLMRVRVTDAVGDSHERAMDLLRSARVERAGFTD